MGLKKPYRSNLFIIVILTALGFLFWIGGLFIFWLILKFLGTVIDFWVMVESLSTAVAAAAVLSAGFIAYRELRAQDISRYIQMYLGTQKSEKMRANNAAATDLCPRTVVESRACPTFRAVGQVGCQRQGGQRRLSSGVSEYSSMTTYFYNKVKQ